MSGNGVAVDYEARKAVALVASDVGALRASMQERAREDERRQAEMKAFIQDSFRRVETLVATVQSSYRDGIEAVRSFTEKSVTDNRSEFDRELRDLAEDVKAHRADDAEKFGDIDGWRWKVAYAVIGFLAITTVGLIGVIYSLVVHAPR